MGPIKIRGSAADRALACAGSIAEPKYAINETSEAAFVGRAVHEACEPIVAGESPDTTAIAQKHGVDHGEVAALTAFARQGWSEVKRYFPLAQSEVRLSGPVTKGRADVVSATPEVLAFLDWKTGRVSDEHPGQLMAYADAARAQFFEPESGEVLAVEVWLRTRELKVERFTMAQLDGFRERLLEQIRKAGKEYNPGEHCRFCPHLAACDAREKWLQSTANAIAAAPETGLADRELLGSLWERSRALRSALAQYEKAVDAALAEGPLELPGGARLEKRTTEYETLRAREAWPVLEDLGLTEDQIAGALSMRKSAVVDAIRANLGEKPARGAVGKAKAEAMQRLRDAEAVDVAVKTERRIVR